MPKFEDLFQSTVDKYSSKILISQLVSLIRSSQKREALILLTENIELINEYSRLHFVNIINSENPLSKSQEIFRNLATEIGYQEGNDEIVAKLTQAALPIQDLMISLNQQKAKSNSELPEEVLQAANALLKKNPRKNVVITATPLQDAKEKGGHRK